MPRGGVTSVSVTPTGALNDADDDMTKLGQARGTVFDRFLTMMIRHREGAITVAREQITEGANPDAMALAQTIAIDQQAEITAMKAILDRLQKPAMRSGPVGRRAPATPPHR